MIRFSVIFIVSAIVFWFLAGFATLDWNVFGWTQNSRGMLLIAAFSAASFGVASEFA